MITNGRPTRRGITLAAAALLIAGTTTLFGATSASAASSACTEGSTPAANTPVTCTTPGNVTLTVPAGVSSVDLEAIGAGGGAGYPSRAHVGGDAARVTGVLTLPADTAFLYVIVGAGGGGNNTGRGFGGGGSGVFALDSAHQLIAKVAIAGAGGGGAHTGDGGDAGSAGTSENVALAQPGLPGLGSDGGFGGLGNYAPGAVGATDDPSTLTLAAGGAGGNYPNGTVGGSGGGGYGGGGGGAAGSQGILNVYAGGGGGGSSLASAYLGNPAITIASNTGGVQLPGLTAGDGADGAVTLTFHAAAVPGTPTDATATATNAQASVSFTAPTDDGGSPITSYTVTSSPGSHSATCSASPCTVTGLTNGTAYRFAVTATNAAGTSDASALSTPVIPSTTPGAPRNTSVVFGDASAVVSWDAPSDDGGSPILGYTVVSDADRTTTACSASPCTVTGLTNGEPYSFHVIARNAVGASSVSVSSTSGTPTAVVVPSPGTTPTPPGTKPTAPEATPTAPETETPPTGSALARSGSSDGSLGVATGALLLGAGALALLLARKRRGSRI